MHHRSFFSLPPSTSSLHHHHHAALDLVLFSAPLSTPSITFHSDTSLLAPARKVERQEMKKKERNKGGREKNPSFDWFYFIPFLRIGWSQISISLSANSSQERRLSFLERLSGRLWVPAAELWPRPAWSGRTFKVLSVTLHLRHDINSAGGGAADGENISRDSQKKESPRGPRLGSECPSRKLSWTESTCLNSEIASVNVS